MTQFNTPGYDVGRPTGVCAFTGQAFSPGQPYIATLVEEGESLARVDVDLAQWEAGQRPEHLFSYWRAVASEPNARKKLFVDDEVLMNLVQRLAGADQPQRLAFRFVLALILMRKKLLRYDGTVTRPGPAPAPGPGMGSETDADHDGQPVEQTWWIMTPKLDVTKGHFGKWNEQERLEVLDPSLDEAGIRTVTEQLSEILQAEL
jgi:hypothetical protein